MQNNYPYDLQLLWDKTENGLLYWHEAFRDSVGLENKNKHFKSHNENTPSTTLSNKKSKDNLYRIFNHSSKEGLTVIDYVKQERNCNFIEACKYLFEKYGLSKSTVHGFKPETTFSDTTKEVGTYKLDVAKKVENFNFFAPFLTPDICNDFNFVSVKSYEKVVTSSKTQKATLIKVVANENYPIFAYKKDTFSKMYEPKAAKDDKYNLKHHFLGKKPERHIYGWDNLFNQVNESRIDFLFEDLSNAEDTKQKNAIRKEIEALQLSEVFIATGGSDGLNLASLGYNVIWFNSEAEIINSAEYHRLSRIAKTIYYVPDLDDTGVKQAVKMGMKFIEIKIVWLPESLKKENKKDLADWVRMHKNLPQSQVKSMFEKIKTLAIEMKFWDWNEKNVSINPKRMLHFLFQNHFRLYKQPFKTADNGKEDDGYFLQVENNIIKKTYPSDIRRFVNQWLDDNFYPINIYNKVLQSNFFNQQTLKALPYFDYKKTACGLNHQYYFFNNVPVLVTPAKIEVQKYSEKLAVSVWEENVINHHFDIDKNPMFEITTDEVHRKRIKVLDNNSNYMKVLINTSRMFWKKDADLTGLDTNNFNINSDKLTEEENYLQELHLLNKMYCVGYMLHQYKSISKAFMVLGMDYELGKSVKGSYGGTGKSFLQKSLFTVLNGKTIGGKTLKTDNFPMDGVTPKTQLVYFDDLTAYQDMEFFYNMITDNLVANQKGGVKYDIPFDDSAKIGATTNFAPNNITPSTLRRLLVYYNSDYYHEATDDNNYPFTRKISDDFGGKNILTKEYSEKEFNADFNFMLQCLQFYLQCDEKINAPVDTLVERNRWQKIGDVFRAYFDNYFSDDDSLNKWVEKSTISKDFLETNGGKTKQQVNDALIEYCAARGWGYEEKKRKNDHGNSVMHFFINTTQSTATVLETEPAPTAEQAEMNFEPVTDGLDF